MNNWIFLGAIPLVAAFISAGYFKEDIFLLFISRPNFIGLTSQYKDKTRTQSIYQEDWRLSTQGQSMYAKVLPNDLPTGWIYKGYSKNRTISAAYVGSKEDGAGVGAIFLKEAGNSEGYSGYIVANDCTVEEVVQCPYVLVPSQLIDGARERFSRELSEACRPLSPMAEGTCKKP